jgi:hypothetical protein
MVDTVVDFWFLIIDESTGVRAGLLCGDENLPVHGSPRPPTAEIDGRNRARRRREGLMVCKPVGCTGYWI